MNVVLMGTGPFAVPSFEGIRAAGLDPISLVVTKPTQSNDRGKPIPNPVLEWAQSHNLPIFQPDSMRDATSIEHVARLKPDLLVVCDYGHILSREALSIASKGGINLHGSLLPRHRGAAPVQWSILAGDTITGISVIHMTPRLDGGPIIAMRSTPVGAHESAAELEPRLSQLGVEATLHALDLLRDATEAELLAMGSPQTADQVTKAPRLSKADGQLDFRYDVNRIDRQIRGLQPWPGAYGELIIDNGSDNLIDGINRGTDNAKKMRVAILKAQPILMPTLSSSVGKSSDGEKAGDLVWGESLKPKNLPSDVLMAVRCRDGLLAIETLQPSGKRAMTSKEFLAGYGKSRRMQFELPASDHHALLDQMSPTHELD